MHLTSPTYGGRIPIDAYGDGGFRVQGEFRPGSLLMLPSEPLDWTVAEISSVTIGDFEPIVAAGEKPEILLIGTGPQMLPLPKGVKGQLESAGLGVELMTTVSAAKTYNVLLSDDRQVAAALIAIE